MSRRAAWTTLVAGGLMLAGVLIPLLLSMDSRAAVVAQRIGPTRCTYDPATKEVVLSVPLRVETRGEVRMEVRAEVHDRRDPSRMPYSSTETVAFGGAGAQEEQRVVHRIAMDEAEWQAGFDECSVRVRTVRS